MLFCWQPPRPKGNIGSGEPRIMSKRCGLTKELPSSIFGAACLIGRARSNRQTSHALPLRLSPFRESIPLALFILKPDFKCCGEIASCSAGLAGTPKALAEADERFVLEGEMHAAPPSPPYPLLIKEKKVGDDKKAKPNCSSPTQDHDLRQAAATSDRGMWVHNVVPICNCLKIESFCHADLPSANARHNDHVTSRWASN